MKRKTFNLFVFLVLTVILLLESFHFSSSFTSNVPGWHTTIIPSYYYIKVIAIFVLVIIFGIKVFKKKK